MNYYRNTKEIQSYEGVAIEPGFLWEKRGQLMVLVDDDEYITCAYDENCFHPDDNK